jgi:diaminopimelate decarboxylase
MGLKKLVEGARVAVDFALAINGASQKRQITTLDIGGGLSVDYSAEDAMSQFPEYARELREIVPELFDPTVFDRVISEFGASVNCKFAWMASRVEYTKECEGSRIAIIHAGSDVFLRSCYCPNMNINYRVRTFDADGRPLSVEEKDLVSHDIAGPLCFAADIVVRNVKIPPVSVDDIVVLCDTGGSTISLRNSHCSRQMPAVYIYNICETTQQVKFTRLRPIQSITDSFRQWD